MAYGPDAISLMKVEKCVLLAATPLIHTTIHNHAVVYQ